MKVIGRRVHFEGEYNHAKGRMMLLLYQYPQMWFSPRRIHEITGVTLSSCRAQCRRMYQIRLYNNLQLPYLERRMVGNRLTQYHYEYHIREGGKNWVIGAIKNGMPISKYISEANEWQSSQKGVNNRSGL
jgi:hypothetical protein